MGCTVFLKVDSRKGESNPRLVGTEIVTDLILSGVEVTQVSVSGEGDVVLFEEFYTPESRQMMRERLFLGKDLDEEVHKV